MNYYTELTANGNETTVYYDSTSCGDFPECHAEPRACNCPPTYVATRTHLNDWVRGTTTYKITATGAIAFITPDADGFHLFTQAFTGYADRTTRATLRGTFATEAAARHAGDALLEAGR